MISHAASRKHYYTVLLDRTRAAVFFLRKRNAKTAMLPAERAAA